MTFSSTEGASAEPQPSRPPGRRRRQPPPVFAPPPRREAFTLPPNHAATVYALPSAKGFVGAAFSMDSLEFMRWAALRYCEDRFTLVVLVYLIGCQDPGGDIKATQAGIGSELGFTRSHITRSFKVLEHDGVLKRVTRGFYQLNPAVVLRGGTRKLDDEGSSRKVKGEPVNQLDLLNLIMMDPDAPEAFKAMAEPGRRLHDRKDGIKSGGSGI
ncbi:replication/maintenance protein RepL [Streptomyces sp. MT29]|nr:replication/maintenance protein RepL [Streptomyces sp. MT29]